MHAGIALTADHLILVILAGQDNKIGLNDATAEAKDQMEGRLLLNVIVSQSAAILELLTSENQTLLVRGDSFLILNLSLDILCKILEINFNIGY